MVDENAVERVRLFCPEDHWQQDVDVDVVLDGGRLRSPREDRPERTDAPPLHDRPEAGPSLIVRRRRDRNV